MSSINTIVKRNGEKVPFDPDKLNKWAEWAADIGVDWSSVVLESCRKCYDGCTSIELHQAMIDSCIDQETTQHLRMAGRLYIGKLIKDVFGGLDKVPTLSEMYHTMVEKSLWAKMSYSESDLQYLNGVINHTLDFEASLTEIKQITEKYAIVDRVAKTVMETPQFVYMRMAMGNMEKMPKTRRIEDVVKLYTYLSQKKINAPTPFFINLGTPKKQYASCCVTTTNDSAASLAAADHIAYMMTCASAGIGAHIKTRSRGSAVRQGLIMHLGKIPYYKVAQAAVGANLQSSRGGAMTMHYNALDPEIMDLLALKNVQAVEQKRVKDIDYSFGFNEEFARRVAKNESWMLVDYSECPELYEAMYEADQSNFIRLYNDVENNPSANKTIVSAREVALKALKEGIETGRVYLHRTDEMNRHTPFKDKIYSSNLCQEIALPTKGFNCVSDLYKSNWKNADYVPEIGLCSLGAIVAGNTQDSEWEDVAYYTVLMIDNVIEIMEYPFPQLAYTAKARRSIGVGITNLAYDMASKGYRYSTLGGKRYIHRLTEMHSYYLHKASLRLAKERGVCEWINKTKYPDGWLPIDTSNKVIDEIVSQPLMFDWEGLRKEIIEVGGLRNSVLEAIMPNESSSLATGGTNSIYPCRSLKVIKTSGTNKNLFIAPKAEELKWDYELAWDVPTKDMLEVYAIVQKFTGQAISADLYISYNSEVGEKSVGAKELLTQFLYFTKLGLKTRYYLNSSTSVSLDDKGCSSGGCTL